MSPKRLKSTISVSVELREEACKTCPLMREHLRRLHRKHVSDNYERFGTVFKTDHGQVQRTSDRVRMVITLPMDMLGKTGVFELESAEMLDFLQQGGLSQ